MLGFDHLEDVTEQDLAAWEADITRREAMLSNSIANLTKMAGNAANEEERQFLMGLADSLQVILDITYQPTGRLFDNIHDEIAALEESGMILDGLSDAYQSFIDGTGGTASGRSEVLDSARDMQKQA